MPLQCLSDNTVPIELFVRLDLTMMISPADMLLFAAIVREGSFTRAARQLGITKQTASERIGKLEERLGVRLLERTTRRLRVTDAGATYYERCAAIAAQIDEANSEVQQRQVEPVGLLRVSAPFLYGRRFLTPVVTNSSRVTRRCGSRSSLPTAVSISSRRASISQFASGLSTTHPSPRESSAKATSTT